uniref:Uncharacterized protein n=1 Tax=Taeniopygia guttata TaxID=59729 RepID=A0A674H8L7_TAEGU
MNLDFLLRIIYLVFLLLFCIPFRHLPLPNIFGLLAGLKHMLCRIRSARCWLLLCLYLHISMIWSKKICCIVKKLIR